MRYGVKQNGTKNIFFSLSTFDKRMEANARHIHGHCHISTRLLWQEMVTNQCGRWESKGLFQAEGPGASNTARLSE